MKRTRSAEGSLEKGQGGCRGAPSISVDRISFKRKRSLEKLEEERREPRPKSPRPAPNITRSYKMPITRLPVLEFPRSGASGTDPESNLRNKIEGCDKTQRQGDLANVKPDIPFFKLIRMAIESSPDKRMLLSEIYTYILGYFPYFKTAGEGWKNSVRHNLSIKSMFYKEPFFAKGKNEPSKKGSYWRVYAEGEIPTGDGDFKGSESTSLATSQVFRRSSTGSHPPTVPFMPKNDQNHTFTSVYTLLQSLQHQDIGRRRSIGHSYQSLMENSPVYGASKRKTAKELSIAQVTLEPPFFSPIEPLPIEMGMDAEMTWLATSPKLDKFIDWNGGQCDIPRPILEAPTHPNTPKASEHLSLPRMKPIGDIWLYSSSPVSAGRKTDWQDHSQTDKQQPNATNKIY